MVLIMPTYFLSTVQKLSKYCANIEQILFNYCSTEVNSLQFMTTRHQHLKLCLPKILKIKQRKHLKYVTSIITEFIVNPKTSVTINTVTLLVIL